MKPIRYRIKKVNRNDVRYYPQVKLCGLWHYISYDGRELHLSDMATTHSDTRSAALGRIQRHHSYVKSKTTVEYEEIILQ